MRKMGKYEKLPASAPATSRYEKLKKRSLLQSYLISLVSLCLCATMLMGTTMAWFTSEVDSNQNEIYVGTLKVDLLMNEQSLAGENAEKVFADTINWEPNHWEIRTLTVEDKGQIPFKYSLGLTLNSTTDSAGNVFENDAKTQLLKQFTVYVKEGAIAENEDISISNIAATWTSKGTLAEIFEKETVIFEGESQKMADKEATYSIAVHMDSDAPNDVMGAKLNFNVKLVATQVGAPETAKNQEELEGALTSGGSVVFSEGIVIKDNVALTGGTIDGSGYILNASDVESNYDCAVTTTGGTVKNLTISGNSGSTRAIGSGSSGTTTMTENLYVDNVTIDYVQYAINGHGDGNCSVYITNSTINGWCSYANIQQFSFHNCKLGTGNSYMGYLVVYGNTSFTNCEFTDFHMCADDTVAEGSTVSFTNCTYGGQKVTAENFKTLFMLDGDATDFNKLQKCTIIVDGKTVTW